MGVCLFVWLSGQRPVSGNKRAPVVCYGITCGVTSLSHRPHPRSYQNSLRGDCWGKLFLFPNSGFFLFVLFPKWLKDLGPKTTWTQSTWFLTVRHVSMVNSSLQADTCSTRAKKHIVSNSRTCFYGELQNLQTDTCSNRYWFPPCVENQNEGSSGQYIWNFLEILWPSVPPTTAQVMSATWWDVQTSWFAEFPQCTFSPCHLIFREQQKKTLSVSFFPLSDSAVKSSCLFHPLFTFICCVPAAAAQDCDTCHALFTMTVPTEVVPENIWHESDVEMAWVDVHTLINISDRSHTDRRLSFLLSCAVDVVWVAGSLPQIFTSGECHTHPSPGVCCQRWRCLAAHLLTQHRAAKFSSLSGHTCG